MRFNLFFLLLFVVLGNIRAQYLSPEPNIIGGNDAEFGERPFQVGIQVKNSYICGGTIIDENNILTAAHCFLGYELKPSDYELFSGIYRDNPYQIYQVAKVILHDDWDEDTFQNDIALVRTTAPIVFDDYVKPVSLPQPNSEVAPGTKAIVSGWGSTQTLYPFPPNVLQETIVTIVNNTVCEITGQLLSHKQLCSNDSFSRKGTCPSDSGGPLTVENELVGVVSIPLALVLCGTSFAPNVYTKVSVYIDWIQNNK